MFHYPFACRYEGFDRMAEREMLKICGNIRTRWEVERIAVVHRTGVCPVGEVSVDVSHAYFLGEKYRCQFRAF